ncbi:sphingosine hydroxylase [Trametes versicolor FP-101664 SS1]|uniref:sphingosine hydroxylase n=1 Tax=Trametes versicolor (strain FP-101664) TaxID=717944 RepID=UPI0004621CFB|nr:sphingosine hydroxylase [Trametes versicolor FP-101664 SS1]EIW57857.1 sphingosine hydroxylase [Trametes versicolor FP-101664 SS1]
MNTTYASAFLDANQLNYLSSYAPFYYTPRTAILDWLPDHFLALAVPVVAYWWLGLVFHLLDVSGWRWLDKYRIHDSAEVQSRNLVTRMQVVWAVLLQHTVQTALGIWWIEVKPTGAEVDHIANMLDMAPFVASTVQRVFGEQYGSQLLAEKGAHALYTLYWWAIPAAKFLLGCFIIDTWQYFLHRLVHTNSYLYRKFHSYHHRLYVPYAYGALYNHPLEGFLIDSLGALIAEKIGNLSTREAMFLFGISTLKTVDDHCGYSLPWDPLQWFSGNNADYHDIHHQAIGIKSNFSQPFFVHWDVLLGTRMTRKDIEARRQKQKDKQLKSQ